MISKTKLKYIQSLSHKKHREAEAVFIAEGPKLVDELLKSNAPILELYATREWIDDQKKKIDQIEIVEISLSELEKISQLKTPNQVLAIVKKFPIDNNIETKGRIILALDTIQDPGNLGTIIRIADWFGVRQIVCSEESADIYNPKVVQSSMGSIARVKVVYTNLLEWLVRQKDSRIYTTTLDGNSIISVSPISEGIIVIGNESKGVDERILELSDTRLTIPRIGKAESLNAAVATGIVLSHMMMGKT